MHGVTSVELRCLNNSGRFDPINIERQYMNSLYEKLIALATDGYMTRITFGMEGISIRIVYWANTRDHFTDYQVISHEGIREGGLPFISEAIDNGVKKIKKRIEDYNLSDLIR